jgi:hypothetical protein
MTTSVEFQRYHPATAKRVALLTYIGTRAVEDEPFGTRYGPYVGAWLAPQQNLIKSTYHGSQKATTTLRPAHQDLTAGVFHRTLGNEAEQCGNQHVLIHISITEKEGKEASIEQ